MLKLSKFTDGFASKSLLSRNLSNHLKSKSLSGQIKRATKQDIDNSKLQRNPISSLLNKEHVSNSQKDLKSRYLFESQDYINQSSESKVN